MKTLTENHKRKLSLAKLGNKNPRFGKPSPMRGKHFSKEAVENMSKSKIGKKQPWSEEGRKSFRSKMAGINHQNFGKKLPERSGKNHPRWIEDRTKALERHQLKNSLDWKQWRMEVFSRDKYTCQDCGDSGVYIEPHHIIPIRSDESKVYEVTNGITLCRPCHKKTIWKEFDFVEKYSAIVKAHS